MGNANEGSVAVDSAILQAIADKVRVDAPLVHCITNYVTVNDCANALLAIGASPIMSDEPDDVKDIVSICNGLVVNIGTLNKRTIESMYLAGSRAAELGRVIVLDPVGAGASALRTQTASGLLDKLPVSIIRANMSEVKALAGSAMTTRGVDADPDDAVTEENLQDCATFARVVAEKTGAIVAITGAIDIVADAVSAYAIRNGVPAMGKVTGTGCMLTCLVAAYAAANPEAPLEAVVAAVASMGLAGQIAEGRMTNQDGNAALRSYLIDALFRMDGSALAAGARVSLVERV